jgi:hypothetical protein
VSALAAELSPAMRSDLLLLVSELVANSVRHGALDEDDWINLWARVGSTAVRVEVSDPGQGFLPEDPGIPGVPEPRSGLWLLDRISDRWGIERDGVTRVWFEADLPTHDAQVPWEAAIVGWPARLQETARELFRLYGTPDSVAPGHLCWRRQGDGELVLRFAGIP